MRMMISSSLPQAFFVLVSLSALCSKEKKWDQYLTYNSDEVCSWYRPLATRRGQQR